MLVFSLSALRALGGLIGSGESFRYWKIIRGLVWLFLVSYLFALFLVQQPVTEIILLLIGSVFFCGGLFVALVLELSRRAVSELKNSDAVRREAEKELSLHRTQALERHKLVAIGQVSGGLAHDFNNLLSIVVGNLDEIREVVPENETLAHQQIESALSAALRGAEVTRALLSVAGRRPLESLEYNINELIQSITPLVNSAVGSDVTFSSQYTDFPLVAKLDATGLNNAILNLANNARDAMRKIPGRKILNIETSYLSLDGSPNPEHPDLSPGHYAVIDVADSGEGMDAETRKQIFEPFFTTKEKGKGTGLGMVMVQDYLKGVGGTVTISSEIGVGTVMSLYIPLNTRLFEAQLAIENQRLLALHDTGLADSSHDARFDSIVSAAASVFDASFATMILVDEDTLWIKSSVGVSSRKEPRYGSFSAHLVTLRQPLIITQANTDPRFSGHPMVTSDMAVRFFVGVPLVTSNHYVVGALCVFDQLRQSAVSEYQLTQLKELAEKAMKIIAAPSPNSLISNLDQSWDAVRGTGREPQQVSTDPFSILIVDDETDLAELAATWLSSFGWKVSISANAAQALQQLSMHHYAILFTDIVMPGGIDGIELAREAQKIYPNIQVLLATGYADRLNEEDTLPGELLTKPYRKSELIDAVSRLSVGS